MGTLVQVLVSYDGEWTMQTGFERHWIFEEKRSKGLTVSSDISYLAMVDEIYSLIRFDKKRFDLQLKVVYDFGGFVAPTEIFNDNDLGFFLREILIANKWRPQLCVSIMEKKLDNVVNGGEGPSQFPSFVAETGRMEQSHDDNRAPKPKQHMFPIENNDANLGLDDIEPVLFGHVTGSNDDNGMDNGQWNNIILERVVDEEVCNNQDFVGGKQKVVRSQHVTANDLHAIANPSTSVPLELVVSASSSLSSSPIKEGDLFENKKELQAKLYIYAIKKNFEFKVVKSATDIWVTACIDVNCKWRLRARKLKESDTFEIQKMVDEHTCNLDVRHRDHRQAAPWLIGHCIKDMYRRLDPTYKPRTIIEDMRRDYGFEMSYNKTWRCREKALSYVWGTLEMSYQKLPSWCHLLEKKNPGTITHIVTTDDDKFLYFFMALGASIHGFKSIVRPVLAVDGSFLKGVYRGTLLEAIAKDGNGQLYPVAFAVVDSENHNSWKWFMLRLKECLGDVENLVFVSDRHQSIMHALETVFPEAHHGACIHHISMNIRSRFKSEHCHEDYFIAVKHYRRSQFHKYFSRISTRDAEMAKYLEEIGFEKWARSYFPGHRYDIMTTNIAESMNSVTADARTYPITSLVEFIRHRMQSWFCDRWTQAEQATTILATEVEKDIRTLADSAQNLHVHPINHYEFEVEDGDLDGLVNIVSKTCTCRKFDLTGLPCEHALAVARFRNISVYQLCSRFYTTKAWLNSYAKTIYPLRKEEDWDLPEIVRNRVVKPPFVHKKSGRPKQRRRQSQGEKLVIHRRCSRCGGLGHNRASCK